MDNTKELYTVNNPSNAVYIVYEVGRFEPGSTDIELNEAQVQLMADQAILTCTKSKLAVKPTAKVVTQPTDVEPEKPTE